MSKLYVFGIGGTGSRVLRALSMLLASGVRCDADTIVPIVIDPDEAGGDVERAATLMRHYGNVRDYLDFSDNQHNRFFRTEIRQIVNNFHMPLENTSNTSFKDYMGVSTMSKPNKALANALFSEKNLNSDMTVGFKGNPNIGSVVLNQFETSDAFAQFANGFAAGDRIFIISSIFGGTGASGFPLLVKTLRTSQSIANPNLVNTAPIGAVTVLPYFKVEVDEDSQIDSSTFVTKARSALAYYDRTFTRQGGNNRPDILYYIGDDQRSTVYENNEGGAAQRNNAHFIELASAMAILDFANTPNVQTNYCVYKEFGIENDVNEIILGNLGIGSQSLVAKPMTQFALFAKYLRDNGDFTGQPWAKDRGINNTFIQDQFLSNLNTNILSEYLRWLDEMGEQQRAFTPFDTGSDIDRVFDLVKGRDPSRVASLDRNYALLNNRLNGASRNVTDGKVEQQFMEVFYLATERLCREKLNIQ